MSSIRPTISTVPAKWALKLLKLSEDEFYDYMGLLAPDSIDLAVSMIELSDDPNDIMSACIYTKYAVSHGLDPNDTIVDAVNNISSTRWFELMSMRADVLQECVHLFVFLDAPPSTDILEAIAPLVELDSTAADILSRIWLDRGWSLSIELIFAIQSSFLGWEFLRHFLYSEHFNSFDLLSEIANHAELDSAIWHASMALIGTNGSALEYLLHLDAINADGIESTIQTLEDLDIWCVISFNPAASPIIDAILAPTNDECLDSNIRTWAIPLLRGDLICKYVTVDDIRSKLVDEDYFFSNASAIHIIEEWAIQEGKITERALDGLLSIASQSDARSALKAINIISDCYTTCGSSAVDMIPDDRLGRLLSTKHASEFAKSILQTSRPDGLYDAVLERFNLVPYWEETSDRTWKICNLTPTTATNISPEFLNQLEQHPALIGYDNWVVLLGTDFGSRLALKHVEHIIERGVLFALIRSPFITKDDLVILDRTTYTFECCDDADFVALTDRQDVYDIDLSRVQKINRELCQSILAAWHDPYRLVRLSPAGDIRQYLAQH
jgi:hypothetical protein